MWTKDKKRKARKKETKEEGEWLTEKRWRNARLRTAEGQEVKPCTGAGSNEEKPDPRKGASTSDRGRRRAGGEGSGGWRTGGRAEDARE